MRPNPRNQGFGGNKPLLSLVDCQCLSHNTNLRGPSDRKGLDQPDFGTSLIMNPEATNLIGTGDQIDPLGIQSSHQIHHRGLSRAGRVGVEDTRECPSKRLGMAKRSEVLIGVDRVGDR